MIAIKEKDLIKVLLLLKDNEHLSASREGLIQRAQNRKHAIKELQRIMDISDEESDNLFQKYYR